LYIAFTAGPFIETTSLVFFAKQFSLPEQYTFFEGRPFIQTTKWLVRLLWNRRKKHMENESRGRVLYNGFLMVLKQSRFVLFTNSDNACFSRSVAQDIPSAEKCWVLREVEMSSSSSNLWSWFGSVDNFC
jgi:hypothetical protein